MALDCLENTTKHYGTNMNSVTDLKDLFKQWGTDLDPGMILDKDQSSKATFSDDPLALSCASYRIYKEQAARRFTNIDLVKATQEDRVHAQAIRDYYNQRYTMRVLKGGQLTEYQQKTAQFLSGLHHLTTEELGLLYKLPYFYEEDRALEQVVATTGSAEFQLPHLSQLTNYTLTPLIEILKSRKGAEIVEFVYRDQHNHAVIIVVRAGDNMAHMLRGLFRQPYIRVQAHTAVIKLDSEQPHNAKKLTAWELIL
jgi:hypothetical protein